MDARAKTVHERIPSLDGLRAVSIVMVLFGHLAGTRGFPVSVAWGNFFNTAELGVHVFFVISGFLITRLLLEELARKQRIDLGFFYLRRTLRIFPPYYTFILVMVFAQAAGWIALAPHDALRAVTYTTNYDESRSWYVGHTWSLSVEEQFYLLWPAVLLLARTRRAVLIAAATVLAAPLVRVALWEIWRLPIGTRFETVADAIAIGCVLAGTRDWLHRSPVYMRVLGSPLFALVPAAAVAANMTHDHPLVYFAVSFALVNICVVLCLDWVVTHADGTIGRVLNARPLVFVGVMSYSLYLWQQPFLHRASTAAVASFPLNIGLAVVCALVSYYVIELPSLRSRRRIEQWFTARRGPAPGDPAAVGFTHPPADSVSHRRDA
ncbi:MAG: acyltransferase [Vicinamibacterales bacterium]